jgi:hypothetical protein
MIAPANGAGAGNFLAIAIRLGHDPMVSSSRTAQAQGGTMKPQMALAPILLLTVITGASAQSQDEQQACTNDAFQFCQYAIPDRDRVFACLVQNRNVLSAACHTVMLPYLPADRVVSKKPASKPKSQKGSGPLNLTHQ